MPPIFYKLVDNHLFAEHERRTVVRSYATEQEAEAAHEAAKSARAIPTPMATTTQQRGGVTGSWSAALLEIVLGPASCGA